MNVEHSATPRACTDTIVQVNSISCKESQPAAFRGRGDPSRSGGSENGGARKSRLHLTAIVGAA